MEADQHRIKSLHALWQHLREDWSVNDKSLARPGFQAMAAYRFGVWRLGIRWWVFRAPCTLLYNIAHVFIRNVYGVEIYDSAKIGRRLRIAHQHGIVVHPNAVIGDDCLIRQGVSIGRASNHGGGMRAKAPVLGDRVEVGAGAVIVGGIVIGDDVVIGPNAVVMTNVPSGSMAACPPARIMARPPTSGNDEPANERKPAT